MKLVKYKAPLQCLEKKVVLLHWSDQQLLGLLLTLGCFNGFLFPGLFLHCWQRDPHRRLVPGRLEAEWPCHHAEVPPHEGEPALGVRCWGTHGLSCCTPTHQGGAGNLFLEEHGCILRSLGMTWYTNAVGSPAISQAWGCKVIQLTTGF